MILRIEEDGTRVYSNYTRYKPKSPSERKYNVRKPADAEETGAERWKGEWLLPLQVLPDDERQPLPVTVSDDMAALHDLGCRCTPCLTPRVRRLRLKRIISG